MGEGNEIKAEEVGGGDRYEQYEYEDNSHAGMWEAWISGNLGTLNDLRWLLPSDSS